MQPNQREFLTLTSLPARLSAEQAGWFLGFNPNEISVLVSVRILKPLGHPPSNASKFFATSSLLELRNEAWLGKASDAIVKFWRDKNAGRKRSLRPLLNAAA